MQNHILILGGGFGGLAAANELRAKLPDAKITVIDKKDYFMMDLVKLWIIKGSRQFETSKKPLRLITKKGIDFVNESVTKIDPIQKRVLTTSRAFSYDYLIIALGVELAPEKIVGLEQFGLILYDINQISKIRQKIIDMESGKIAIAITGMPYKCPPAPFEAALIINHMLKELGKRDAFTIDFYSTAPITLPAAGPEVSAQVLQILESEKINFYGSCKTMAVEEGTMQFENKNSGEFDLLIAVPPHKAPSVVYESGLAMEDQFIVVGRDCKTPHDGVYAIGDVTTMMVKPNIAVPKAGIFAESEGIEVAKDIISRIKNEKNNSIFGGKGGCFVETGKSAGYVYVDMFADPDPITRLDEPAEEHMREKEKFENERLRSWF